MTYTDDLAALQVRLMELLNYLCGVDDETGADMCQSIIEDLNVLL